MAEIEKIDNYKEYEVIKKYTEVIAVKDWNGGGKNKKFKNDKMGIQLTIKQNDKVIFNSSDEKLLNNLFPSWIKNKAETIIKYYNQYLNS
jgi:hypothetical protein